MQFSSNILPLPFFCSYGSAWILYSPSIAAKEEAHIVTVIFVLLFAGWSEFMFFYLTCSAKFAILIVIVTGNVTELIIPIIATIIPQYILYARLGMINTFWPWILSALAGTPLYIFLFRQFFLGFPRDLEEAAEVDGCGPLRLFVSIFLPNAKPAIATVMIFAFMSVWGDYFTPLIFLNPENTLLGVALARYFGGSTGVLAATVLYIIPVIIIFFFAQKYILKGVVTTGLKG